MEIMPIGKVTNIDTNVEIKVKIIGISIIAFSFLIGY
jgi:hypothetical protein